MIILIDGKNALYRYGHAIKNLRTEEGFPTGAIYGTINAILRLRKQYKSGRVVVVWDGLGYKKGWRNKLYPEYKGNREKKAPSDTQKEIFRQEPQMKAIFRSIGVIQSELEGVEADDIIGILAARHIKNGPVVIYSSDKDFMQLMPLGVTVIRDTGKNRMTPETVDSVCDSFRCMPEDILKIRAICGDSSDNIPRAVFKVGPAKAGNAIAAGADPSKEKCPKGIAWVGKEAWSVIHNNYRIMRILQSVDDREMPEDQRQRLGYEINRIDGLLSGLIKPVGRSQAAMYTLLGEFELQDAIAHRQDLWSLGER